MENNIALDNLLNEVQRKLGRNLILFQCIEHMMKDMLINQEITISKNEVGFISNQQVRKDTFTKQTMGQISKQFFSDTFRHFGQNYNDESTEDSDVDLSTKFKMKHEIECNKDFIEERAQKLDEVINERNELVHHFVPKWNFDDYESLHAAENYLDRQRERALPEFELLKSLSQNFMDSRKLLAEILNSDEGFNLFSLAPLLNTKHILCLIEYANSCKRPDGWALLSSAGLFICKTIPEDQRLAEREWIKKQHRVSSLKEIVEMSGYFETHQELTEKSGIRLLYRIKPDQ
jgi:hypothetical protein